MTIQERIKEIRTGLDDLSKQFLVMQPPGVDLPAGWWMCRRCGQHNHPSDSACINCRHESGRAEQPDDQSNALTFAEFSRANRARCEAPDGFNHQLGSWSTSDWFTAILGELGEAANVAKKLNRVRDGIPGNKQTPDELRAKLRAELADTFIYLDLLAQSVGVSLVDAVAETFNAKSYEIGYPVRLGASR